MRSSASAIKFGTASYGGFKNVTIEIIEIFDTFRSAIALETVDGGIIENINIHKINTVNTGNVFFIRLGHRAGITPVAVPTCAFQHFLQIQISLNKYPLHSVK